MRHMERIPVNETKSFVLQQLSSDPPVFWEFVVPRGDGERFEDVGSALRRRDSNTLEIAFPPAAYAVGGDDQKLIQELEGAVRRYAGKEDERELRATEGPLPAGVGFELESLVPGGERGSGAMLGVIGPGGRATAFRGARGITGADVTIRRRGRAKGGIWRRLEQILRPLEQALGEDFAGTEEPTVRAAFGYFELSKYEAQSLMRPVFLFAIVRGQDPEGRWPGFQRIVVSSATSAGEFDQSEGLGMWAESTQCSG